MTKNNNVPKVRFKGFTDAWEQREFGNVFEEYSEKNHEELPPLTIIQGKGTILRDESDRNLIYDKAGLKNYKLVNKDDFILHLRSFEGGLEVANSKGIVSPAYHIFHGENVDTGFYYPFFRSKFFISVLLKPHVYGIRDGKSIDVDGMKTIKIPYPKIEEQQAIGNYFKSLDNLITLHQRKCETLQKLKKSMLQKMFPKNGSLYPEIRFAGFTDAWEQRKLITIADVLDGDRGKNYPTESDFTASGHTLFLNASNVTKDGFSFVDNQYISEEKSDSMGNGKLQEDDIVVTSRGSLGHIAWYNDDIMRFIRHARINSGMLILRKKMTLDSSYLYQFMKSHKGQEQISFISFGSAQPQLTKAGVEKLNIDLPNDLEEQTQIGSFFSQLDTLITLHQRKLEKLKNIKKAMLEKMFV